MKNLLLVLILSLGFAACSKDEVAAPDAPRWLRLKISETEATIQSDAKSILKISTWYRYQFNGNTYYEYVNPTLATWLNLYDASGHPQQNLTSDFVMSYEAGKTNKFLVWSGPDFKDFRPENGAIATLQKTWVNSVEEQTSDNEFVYRPEHYKDFIVLRYRHQFIFNEGGQGKTLALAPNDGHYFLPMNWAYSNITHILEIKNNGPSSAKYLVTELRGDILKLKKL